MAGSVNKVILVGRLGKPPEARNFSNGGKVVNFSLATSESWKDRNSGEKKEKTTWHNVAVFNEGLAGVAERFLDKGSLVYLEGKLQTRKYQDNNGNDKFVTEVVLQGFDCKLEMLGGGKGSGGRSADDEYGSDYGGRDYGGGSGGKPTTSRSGGDSGPPNNYDLDDSDVPF